LAVTAIVSPDPPVPGEEATVTLSVRNIGDTVAEGVRLVDELPPGITVRSATSLAGACQTTVRRAECPLGSLAPGETVSVLVRLQLDDSATGALVQHVVLSAGGQAQIVDRSISTLVSPPARADVLGVPGPMVTLIAFVGFVLAARSSSSGAR
jgi:uncharacterized repeat protein (TIGR01451 family)